MLQNTSHRGGGGVRRVLSVASIANQPHAFDNKYVAGSGVGAKTTGNRRALMRRAATSTERPLTCAYFRFI
jgi:hypothetical protein